MFKGAKLTPLQIDTLQALADDKSATDVAHDTGASVGTVHGRLFIARKKLGATNTWGAVAEGFRRGMLH